jgi:uncharacterized protein
MRYQIRLSTAKNKILILTALLLFPLLIHCFAQTEKEPTTEAAPQKDYSPYPAPSGGYVTDTVGIITDEDEKYLNTMIYQTEKKVGFEMAIVTIGSIRDYPGGGSTIEEFATGLFNSYGIGNLPENKGVLFLVARDDRKARIELGAGYGRSRDADASRIMEGVIIPHFRKDQYSRGIVAGSKDIAREFGGVRWTFPWSLIIIPLLILLLIFVAISLFKSGKKGWGWVLIGIIVILLLAMFKIIGRIVREIGEATSHGGGAGGFGGGFGGGFSGGGGATGGW